MGDTDSKVKGLAKKTWMDKVGDAFAPAADAADQRVQENRESLGTQLQNDMQETNQERMKRLQKGFLGQ